MIMRKKIEVNQKMLQLSHKLPRPHLVLQIQAGAVLCQLLCGYFNRGAVACDRGFERGVAAAVQGAHCNGVLTSRER